MHTLSHHTCKSILKIIIILVIAFALGAASAVALSGCNMVTRAAVGAGQGLVEDVGSAYRHARHQVDYADRTVRHEDDRLQEGGQQ